MPSPSSPDGDRTGPPPVREVTPSLLRSWPLPAPTDSKYSRGQVLIVGGAARTPGAVQLAGLAALRVGAGHLTMAVAEKVAVAMAVATPEAGVVGLPQNGRGSVLGGDLSSIADDVGSAQVVTVGVGLDDPEQTALLLQNLIPHLGDEAWLVLDAYALGVLPGLDEEVLAPVRGRLVLTPNKQEAGRLLGRDLGEGEQGEFDLREVAHRYGAVVSCSGAVANATGELWRVGGRERWSGHLGQRRRARRCRGRSAGPDRRRRPGHLLGHSRPRRRRRPAGRPRRHPRLPGPRAAARAPRGAQRARRLTARFHAP